MPKYKIEYHAYYESFSDVDSDDVSCVDIVEETEEFSSAREFFLEHTPEGAKDWEYTEMSCGVGYLCSYDKQTKYKQYYQATPIEEKSSGQKHYESWRKQIICPKVPTWDELDEKVKKTWDLANEENKDSVS